jgi:dimethylamine monooxygenase subunit A
MPDPAITELKKYFTDAPYHFSMAFGRSTFGEFFAQTASHHEIIGERQRLLDEFPDRHLAVLPDAQPLIEETVELGIQAGTLGARCPADAFALGRTWEADFLLLTRETTAPRLVCGCVCFPSSWSLEEKIGKEIDSIHSVVPGLNVSVGRQINTFLSRLKPGVAWTRSNWGLSRWPNLNQHPALALSRLDQTATAERVYFRVEEQALVGLPRSNGILFGIRIKVFALPDLIESGVGENLARALETMPEEMAKYKGLAVARPRLIKLLRPGPH